MKKLMCFLLLCSVLTIHAQNLPDDALLPADSIRYWVGGGNHYALVAVNWCNPNVAMCWGVRFSGDSILVADLMNTIRIYDTRFNYLGDNDMMSEITFHDSTYSLALHGNWWMYNINGYAAWNGYAAQYVHHGDFIKWGDESCGQSDEYYNYVWTTSVQPVTLPTQPDTLFDGIVGTPGCQAVPFDDPSILGWATGCVITRGPQDIAASELLASYGDESAGIGAATESTTEAVSLGDGGIAVLSFSQPIQDGEGYDFAVFENALNDTFLELAFVEVSSDGEHYYRFPATSNTPSEQQLGNAGSVDARHLHNLAGKYRAGWGTPFDLNQLSGYGNLDLNNITHVRIVDVVGSINPAYGTTDGNGHLINDPYPTLFASGGFDLSGAAILNGWMPNNIHNHLTESTLQAYPNPCSHTIYIYNLTVGDTIELYNTYGQLLWHSIVQNQQAAIPMKPFPAGLYIVKCGATSQKIYKR